MWKFIIPFIRHSLCRYETVNPTCTWLYTPLYSKGMRETILIVSFIFLAFLFSGLAGVIIGATLSPAMVLGGAGLLAALLVVVILVALWKQQQGP